MDLVREVVTVRDLELDLLRPRDGEALIDEREFAERDEFLPYWAELWPSGVALAEVVADRALPPRVLEIGAGLGVPSLVAALRGAEVTATDWSADAVALLARNAERNGTAVDVRLHAWTEPFGDRWPLVLAADVLYEARNGEQLLRALPALGDELWIADPDRPAAPAFFAAAAEEWDIDALAPRVHRLRLRRD